jgi:hypothetical protein
LQKNLADMRFRKQICGSGRRYAVPEGSVIMIGSLSHLMEEGRVGYAKGLVTEQIRFSKAFKNTVHVVPFVPPPICGTNDRT